MEKSIIHSNSVPGVAYSRNTSAIINTNITEGHIIPISKEVKDLSEAYVPWGTDNLFPQRILKEVRKNTIVGPTLRKKAEIATMPIQYGMMEDGKFVPKNGEDEEVDAFLRRMKPHRYALQFFSNFYWFYNAFPDIIFTKDKSKVYSLGCNLKTAFCRFQKPDESTGELKNVYVNADWEETDNVKDKSVMMLPVIPQFTDLEELKRESNQHRYVFPISYPTENESQYALADWNSLRTSGWLSVAQAIPEFKKRIFENQITIKYMIDIPTWWWNWMYKGFDDFDVKKKKKFMDDEIDKFEKFMKGTENSGNSMVTTSLHDIGMDKSYEGWKITPIDNKLKDGIYIEDSNEASSHLLYALGLHDSLLGSKPGKNMGAGSGSDMRVAFNIYLEQVSVHHEFALEPFYFIQEYNGWKNYVWRFENRQKEETPASKQPLNEPQQQAS